MTPILDQPSAATAGYPQRMPRPSRPQPYVLSADWPHAPSSDPAGEAARLLALNLAAVIRGKSARSVEAETGIDHTVIGKILNGKTWADLATITRLENALDTDLWPTRSQRRSE